MTLLQQSIYYKIDPELRIIHLFHDCSGLKAARKFNYMRELKALDDSDMVKLDDLLTEGYRTCHGCWSREQMLCRKDNRRPRPGFKREPRK